LPSQAQKKNSTPSQKLSLTHTVYDSWKEISYKAITNDGHFAAFTVNPQEGDGKVIFYDLRNQSLDSVKRAENISLTFDNQFAVFKIKPQTKLVKDLRRQKKKKEDLPKDIQALAVVFGDVVLSPGLARGGRLRTGIQCRMCRSKWKHRMPISDQQICEPISCMR